MSRSCKHVDLIFINQSWWLWWFWQFFFCFYIHIKMSIFFPDSVLHSFHITPFIFHSIMFNDVPFSIYHGCDVLGSYCMCNSTFYTNYHRALLLFLFQKGSDLSKGSCVHILYLHLFNYIFCGVWEKNDSAHCCRW